MMGVLVILIVSCHMLVIYGLDITVCKNGRKFPSVKLNCSNKDDMIHVESIRYFYKQESDCSTSSTETCGLPLTNSMTGLLPACSGQPSPCSQFIPNTMNCTGSTVNYRCIPRENGQDMCQSKLNLKENAGRISLFSPNYPTATGFKPNEPRCQCDIRGTNITSITIFDLRLQTGSHGTRSNLFIQYGDITYNKTSRENHQSPEQVYNHRLQSTPPSTTADIIFTHQEIHGQKLWIEILGTSLTGSCNKGATNVSLKPRSTTPVTSPPQPDSTTTSGTSPSSTSTATHTTTTSTENNTDSSTISETSTVDSTTVNNTESSTTTDHSTSSETPTVHSTTLNNIDSNTTTGSNTSSETSTDTSERPQPATDASGNDFVLIVGFVVGGLVLIFIVVIVCVLVRIRRKRTNVLQQNVHVHINNTTNNTVNNTSPNYFVLESLNTQDEDVKHDDISTNTPSMTTGRTPEYAVVNKTGRQFNVTGVNPPDQATKRNETGELDMEILENELYVPYEASNNSDDTRAVASTTNNIPQHGPSGDMEILENELYIPYEASNNPDDTGAVAATTNNIPQHGPSGDMEILENELYIPYEAPNNPDDTDAVTSTTNNTTQHRPLGDMEIMENDLYVPFEDSAVEVSKPVTSSVYDNAAECGTQQDVTAPEMEIGPKKNVATPEMEILENDLYVPGEDTDKIVYDNAHKTANKPTDQAPVMEILENDLYVPFEKTQE